MMIVSHAWSVMASPSSKAELRHRLAAQGRAGTGVNPHLAFSFLVLSVHSDPALAPTPALQLRPGRLIS